MCICIYIYMYIYIYIIYIYMYQHNPFVVPIHVCIVYYIYLYGVATISRLLKITVLLCKRALSKRRYSAQETYDFK